MLAGVIREEIFQPFRLGGVGEEGNRILPEQACFRLNQQLCSSQRQGEDKASKNEAAG